jgi:3-oxoadipate enol-lactonase
MQVQANGITINYTLDGPADAPVVTLSHSLACDVTMWDPQMAMLTAKYRVLRFDTRGHGKTSAPAGAYTLDMLAEDARGLLKALNIPKTHWIGLSMGGMIGQMLALQSPGLLQSLTICDSSSRVPPEARPMWQERIDTAKSKGMAALVDSTLGRWFTEPFLKSQPAKIEPIRKLILNTPVDGYCGCGQAISQLDNTDKLPAIKLPTLIVVGRQDVGTPVAASEVMHGKIAGSKLVILEDASHISNVEQPETFNKAIGDFLAQVAR